MSDTRKPRTKRRGKTAPFSLRLTPQTIEKLGWIAAERGTTTAEVARSVLHDIARTAKPPEGPNSPVIRASDAEWEAWRTAAEKRGQTLDELVRYVLSTVARNVLEN